MREQASYPLDVRAHIRLKRLNVSASVIHLNGDEWDVVISCAIEGGHQPAVLWKRDGQIYEGKLTTTTFAFGVVARIEFPRATYEKNGNKKNFAGEYILWAEQESGRDVEMCMTKIIIESNYGSKFFIAMAVIIVASTDWLRMVTRELNILAGIGDHPNIIQLVTALMMPTTFGPDLGDFLIVMEYCANGDLTTYLRRHREYFQDEFLAGDGQSLTKSSSSRYTSLSGISDNCVTTSDLLQWTIQLACAMEYLASQHIIHGDLALRNLLLTGSNVLKISDFGLSKRLDEDNEYYTMKADERIPWANCAPEFLEHGRASTRTDVWAFGVSVWEMFTLGDTPYNAEFNAYSYTFLNALKNGHRLCKPGYANSTIYDIMSTSWHLDPEQRPSFGDVVLAMEHPSFSDRRRT